jgi:hypothetical protein
MQTSYYLPLPPRVWSRVQDPCTYLNPNDDYTQSYVPLTNQTISLAQANYQNQLLNKGNILQYKKNSAQLTKKQKYSQLTKGLGPSRTKVFATQTDTYTNPNTSSFLRVNYTDFPFPNQLAGQPNNISGPFQYNVPNPFNCSSNTLQDGGNLVYGTYANQCTGEIIKECKRTDATICNPSSCSDVPGRPIVLCWNNKLNSWYPKKRYIMNSTTDKWPENYKGFVSALKPDPPILKLVSQTSTSATLSWTTINSMCIPTTSYNIYNNNVFLVNLPYNVLETTIQLQPGTNSFNITSLSTDIESVFSNTIFA